MHADKVQGNCNSTYRSRAFHVYSLLLAGEGVCDGENGGISGKICANWGDLLSEVNNNPEHANAIVPFFSSDKHFTLEQRKI